MFSFTWPLVDAGGDLVVVDFRKNKKTKDLGHSDACITVEYVFSLVC